MPSDLVCGGIAPSSFARTPFRRGSTLIRNFQAEVPRVRVPHPFWPIAHMLRFTCLGVLHAAKRRGNISQCSSAVANCLPLAGIVTKPMQQLRKIPTRTSRFRRTIDRLQPLAMRRSVISAASPLRSVIAPEVILAQRFEIRRRRG